MGLFKFGAYGEEPTFPELPELNAAKRAKLFSYIITLEKFFDSYLLINDRDEYITIIASYFTSMIRTLLDGSTSAEEYLSKDTSRNYEIIGADVILEENGRYSFVCPYCGIEILFDADKDQCMEAIRKVGSVKGCCPSCKHIHKLMSVSAADALFTGKLNEC